MLEAEEQLRSNNQRRDWQQEAVVDKFDEVLFAEVHPKYQQGRSKDWQR